MNKILDSGSDHELIAGEDYIPFEEHYLYLTSDFFRLFGRDRQEKGSGPSASLSRLLL